MPRHTKCGPPGTAQPQRSIVACCPGKPSVVLQALHIHSAALLHVAQANQVWSSRHCTATAQHCCMLPRHTMWSSRHCTATAQHCCMLPKHTCLVLFTLRRPGLTDQEVEVPDALILPHQCCGQAELAVSMDDANDLSLCSR